jgi:hypothetical protein
MHGREDKYVEVVFGKLGGKRINTEIDVEEV